MVHKKFIKRGGKVYGPYYYHSYRENGKVKKRYLTEEQYEKLTNKEGEEKEFRIISIDPADHRLGLSLRPPRAEGAVEPKPAPTPDEGGTPTEETKPEIAQTPA